jgi:hypothetical protein
MGVIVGRTGWTLDASLDTDGIQTRNYKIQYLVRGEVSDNPYTIVQSPGLPTPFATLNIDPTCLCIGIAAKRTHVENEPGEHWTVDCNYTNHPLKRCSEANVENPLLQPADISGSFVSFTKGTSIGYKSDNTPYRITNSVGQIMDDVERDYNRPQVVISKNVATLNLSTYLNLIDRLNDSPIWGCPAGTVKFSNFTWKRNFYGTCGHYYTVTFTFDISFVSGYDPKGNPITGWIQARADHGDMYLPENKPQDVKYLVPAWTTPGGKIEEVFLDGRGHKIPGSLNDGEYLDDKNIFYWYFQPYQYGNLQLLGLPVTL